jgi:hypothetical protein
VGSGVLCWFCAEATAGEPKLTKSQLSGDWLAVEIESESSGRQWLGVSAMRSQVVRQSPVSKDVKTEAEEYTVLGDITKQQPVKTQQTKNKYVP